MSAVASCVVCSRPLDDDRKRRADAVTCSRACRTALWRARRKIRRDGGVPYIGVTSDGSPAVARFDPPASPATSPSEARFRAQMDHLEEAARPLTDEERHDRARVRDLMRRNPGVLLPPLHDRLIQNSRKAQAAEDEIRASVPMAVQDVIHNPDPTVIARRGMMSRQANRHMLADPNAYVDRPQSGPYPGRQSGPPSRYPHTPENTMLNTPGRNTPRWAMPG